MKQDAVAPLVGAWIEIDDHLTGTATVSSLLSWERGLKYRPDESKGLWCGVAPLVGAWIEIVVEEATKDLALSLLSWERGLKYQ